MPKRDLLRAVFTSFTAIALCGPTNAAHAATRVMCQLAVDQPPLKALGIEVDDPWQSDNRAEMHLCNIYEKADANGNDSTCDDSAASRTNISGQLVSYRAVVTEHNSRVSHSLIVFVDYSHAPGETFKAPVSVDDEDEGKTFMNCSWAFR